MSIERVRKYLQQFGRGDDIIETAASSATVELAAAALGVEPARIAKTLSFMAKSGVILIVAAGDCKIDNRKYKELFGCKAKMLSPDEVLQYTGHAVGGVCPFGIPETYGFIPTFRCNDFPPSFRPAAAAILPLN